MHSILHRLIIETTPEKLFQALTSQQGLNAWWTKTTASNGIGSVNSFFFGPDDHQVDMEIRELKPNEQVSWQCVSGPWEEKGLFSFTISPDKRGSVLHFSHAGWPETDDFYQHCNAKWGFFLVVSLKNYLETGVGQPHPDDPGI